MTSFVALDLETTWVNHQEDSIIEYAFIKFDQETFIELDVLSWYINPQTSIPALITELTWISDTDVIHAPTLSEIRDDIQQFIAWCVLVWHNIRFDIWFLVAAWIPVVDNPYIDTFTLANFLSFRTLSLSLSSLCSFYDIPLVSSHRALDDTRACLHLFQLYISFIGKQASRHSLVYAYLFSRSDNSWDRVLYNVYIKKFIENEVELPDIESIKHVHKQLMKWDKKMDVDYETELTDISKNSYDYISEFPKFEWRESQKIMCDIVDKLFHETLENWYLAIEAPTGTWKTFWYLIAALLYAQRTWEQVCVSTSTKILQDQICNEDITYLKKYLPFSFSYAKIMWRKNYFSLESYYEYLTLFKSLSSEQISFFLKIYLWSIESDSGELRELEYYGEEFTYLSYIHTPEWKNHTYSQWYEKWEFYLKARKNIKNADIIITNTHVLLQDLDTDNSIFWDIHSFIIDEAHSLEDIVTSSQMQVFWLSQLHQIFWVCQRKIQIHKLQISLDEIYSQIEYKVSDILFECWKIAWSRIYYNPNFKKYLFTSSDILENTFFQRSALHIISLLCEVIQILDVPNYQRYFSDDIHKIEQIKNFLQNFFVLTDYKKYIYMCEVFQDGRIQLSSTILHTWVFLRSELWDKKNRILLTSATLFQDWKEWYSDILFWVEYFEKHTLPPVFDYSKQAYIYIPNNLSDTKNLWDDTLDFLSDFFTQVGWKTLMLCTSYKSIKEIYLWLHTQLLQRNISLIAQWFAWGRNKHLESYLKSPDTSILVWTDSFWQWIDLSWENLKYLVIHKLPFTPPSDPVFTARSMLFKNWFYDYAIPKASIKLRQWFWRLIRSHSDSGMVLFLDERVMTHKWWKDFLTAFPKDVPIIQDSTDNLLKIIT